MGLRNALQLRLSDDVLAKVVEAAKQQGLPPSTYGRQAIEKAATRDLLQKDASDGDLSTASE